MPVYELRLTIGPVTWDVTCERPSNKAALANGMRILRNLQRQGAEGDIEARILTINGKEV